MTRYLQRAWPAADVPRGLLPLVLAGLVTVVAWPIANVSSNQGLDRSWQIALHLAADIHLRNGVDFVFTFGPLGFLGFPHPYLGGTSSLAFVMTGVTYFALAATMLIEARRCLPLWAASIATLLVARAFVFLPPWEALFALVAVSCVAALADRIPLPALAIAAIGGAIASVAALGKLNVGVFVFVLGALTTATIGRPWWKTIATYLATAAATSIVLWLVAGQRLADVPAYVAGAYDIVRGYVGAMGTDVEPRRAWIFLALSGAALILVWAGWRASGDWPRPRRIGLALLGLVLAFAMWKLVIVREHATYAILTGTVLMFGLATRTADRERWLVSVLALAICAAGVSGIAPRTYLDVVSSVRSILVEAGRAFIPGRGDAATARTRAQLRSVYRLEPSILNSIVGRTVHIDPWEAGVAYAYPEIRWAPLPVFQSYSAYTPFLDRLNADRLRAANAPQRVLRQFRSAAGNKLLPATVDGRFRWFEAPEATLETFCRYEQIGVSEVWQVLRRTARSCGPPEQLVTVSAHAGADVNVPIEKRPDRFVIVNVGGLEPSALGLLRVALTKAPDWYVTLDGMRYRFVPGTAADGLLLAVPPIADGTGHFAFGAPIRTIAIAAGPRGRDSSLMLTYEFLSVPLAGP